MQCAINSSCWFYICWVQFGSHRRSLPSGITPNCWHFWCAGHSWEPESDLRGLTCRPVYSDCCWRGCRLPSLALAAHWRANRAAHWQHTACQLTGLYTGCTLVAHWLHIGYSVWASATGSAHWLYSLHTGCTLAAQYVRRLHIRR